MIRFISTQRRRGAENAEVSCMRLRRRVWGSAPALSNSAHSAPLRLCVKISFAIVLTALCSSVANALPLVWRADWPDAKPVETLVHRGTDVELQPLWRINKQPADTNGWTFTTYCQTNAVGPWFGPLPGAFFSHTNDVGAAFYNVMVRAETPGGAVNYTAFARLRMLDSPGFAPGVLPLPAQSIDFADVTVFNAPWATPADVAEATATLAVASNVYTKAETDALIASATPEDYDAVRAQVNTNAADIAALETNKADKAELADYLPLTGGTLNGNLAFSTGFGLLFPGGWVVATDTSTGALGFARTNPAQAVVLPSGKSGTLAVTSDIKVQSVNGKTGSVALTAADVGALPTTGGTLTGELMITNTFQGIGFGFDADRPWIMFKAYGGRVVYTYQPSASGTAALAAPNPTAGHLAALDASGNPVDSGKRAADFLAAAPLDGNTYDFATTQGVMDALAAVIATLGGSVTNKPSAASSGN